MGEIEEQITEAVEKARESRLNTIVAVFVALSATFMALSNVKDGNIVQAMAQAKADSVDHWGEYQATKTKLHIAETAKGEIGVIAGANPSAAAQAATQRLDQDIAKYKAEAPELAKQAKGFADSYDALNVHDDQFDASEALISTAISLAAVAALIENRKLLGVCWCFGAFGMFMGVCGFAGWAFHPDVLSNFLG
jgi:hypothetical protein